MPKALKICPKSNKLPNLVTLTVSSPFAKYQIRVKYKWNFGIKRLLFCSHRKADLFASKRHWIVSDQMVQATWRKESSEQSLSAVITKSRNRVAAIWQISFRPHEEVVFFRTLSKYDSIFRLWFPLKQSLEQSFVIFKTSEDDGR